jgi:hypothetical protein
MLTPIPSITKTSRSSKTIFSSLVFLLSVKNFYMTQKICMSWKILFLTNIIFTFFASKKTNKTRAPKLSFLVIFWPPPWGGYPPPPSPGGNNQDRTASTHGVLSRGAPTPVFGHFGGYPPQKWSGSPFLAFFEASNFCVHKMFWHQPKTKIFFITPNFF